MKQNSRKYTFLFLKNGYFTIQKIKLFNMILQDLTFLQSGLFL